MNKSHYSKTDIVGGQSVFLAHQFPTNSGIGS